jgi:hypothetical protein
MQPIFIIESFENPRILRMPSLPKNKKSNCHLNNGYTQFLTGIYQKTISRDRIIYAHGTVEKEISVGLWALIHVGSHSHFPYATMDFQGHPPLHLPNSLHDEQGSPTFGFLRRTHLLAFSEFQISIREVFFASPIINSLEKSATISQGTINPFSRIVQYEMRPGHIGISLSIFVVNYSGLKP